MIATDYMPRPGRGAAFSLKNCVKDPDAGGCTGGLLRYFLDAEFNGFGGRLISLALVPEDEDAAPFYAALPCPDPEPWTAEHVMPVLRTESIERAAMTQKLADYLRSDGAPLVVADWPEDIAHLALLMVTCPGSRLPTPKLVFELHDLPLFDAQTASEVPHNARYDAMALRDYVLRTDH